MIVGKRHKVLMMMDSCGESLAFENPYRPGRTNEANSDSLVNRSATALLSTRVVVHGVLNRLHHALYGKDDMMLYVMLWHPTASSHKVLH